MKNNLVSQLITSSGTGTLVLGSAVSTFRTLASAATDQETIYYSILDGVNREIGVGTYTLATNSLSRDYTFLTITAGVVVEDGTPLSLSGNGVLSISGSSQELTTHDEVWKSFSVVPSPFYTDLPLYTAKAGGILVPTYEAGGVEKSLGYNFTIPNDAVAGLNNVIVKAHWVASGIDAGVCRWGCEYAANPLDTIPTTATLYVGSSASGDADLSVEAEFAPITVTKAGKEAVMCRVFRDIGHANDTLTDSALLLSIDVFYKAAKAGTPLSDPSKVWGE